MNLLSSVAPWDLVAEGYAETTMKFFHGYADAALAMAGLHPGMEILDIACGPGTLTLSAARQVAQVQAIDFSSAMLDILEQRMQQAGLTNIEARCADAQHLPYADDRFDAAFSLFGLMFFPNRQQAYAEILRTLKPGGRVVLSSWAPVADSPSMQAVFGALRAINPAIPEPQTDIASLENPQFFREELDAAGFCEIEVSRVTQALSFDTLEHFWSDMVRGNAPLAMLKKSMSESEWAGKNQLALDYLHEHYGTGGNTFSADAWLATASKPQ